MKKAFLINAHEAYPFSPGALNTTLIDLATKTLAEKGYEIQVTTMKDDYDVEEEIQKHLWADIVILQTPVNWMGVSWSFKRYMDYVYSAGMDGRLCNGDGRSRKDASKQYGTGGTLTDKKYMLSLTFNAPQESFGHEDQLFFEGKSVDDLFWPMHLNFKFFGMEPLETFVCFDVLKNPQIEKDFVRFEEHLKQNC